jgi:thioredoxin 1
MVQELRAENESFTDRVLDSEKPVLVDFYAGWCRPCLAMVPVLERLEEKLQGRCDVVKIDIEDYFDLAEEFNITSIPALLLFKGGKKVKHIVGALSLQELENTINDVL